MTFLHMIHFLMYEIIFTSDRFFKPASFGRFFFPPFLAFWLSLDTCEDSLLSLLPPYLITGTVPSSSGSRTPRARMHLSLDTTATMVDDGCLASDYHDLKGGSSSVGGRVHSIDVILGFSKDQDPLLNPVTANSAQKMDSEDMLQGKQGSTELYGNLPGISEDEPQTAYQGEFSVVTETVGYSTLLKKLLK